MSQKTLGRPSGYLHLNIELSVTREQIAERLGLSVERIGQLERRALEKMRRAADERGLKLEDLL